MSGWETQIPVVMAITILAVVSPGPDFAMTLRNSLVYGRRAGLVTSAGIAAGISVHILYSILGFSVILVEAVWLLDVIRYLGAGYLVWLGCQPFLKRRSVNEVSREQVVVAKAPTLMSAFRTGFLCNALNPKTTLFFVALFSQVVHPETPLIGQLGFGLFIALAHLVWFAFVATALTHKTLKEMFDKARGGIEKGIGVCLVALGIRLALF
ncbi:MAG: LysE family transporter [Sneathiella sp.]